MDAIQFGKMQAEVETLKSDVQELKRDMKALLELANKGKGGMWAGMTIAGMVGGVLTWLASHLPFIKP